MRKVISLTGSIGSGKTTLLRRLKDRNPSWNVLEEPVDEWLASGWLDRFYKDPERWAFAFQMKIVQGQIEALRDKTGTIVCERSPLDGLLVFGKLLVDQGKMTQEEYDLYRFFVQQVSNPDAIVLLSVPTDQLLQRVCKRNREAEKNQADYLRLVADHYQCFEHLPIPTLIIQPFELDALDKQCEEIEAFLDNL